MEFEKARGRAGICPVCAAKPGSQPTFKLPEKLKLTQAALSVVRFWPSAVMIRIEALGLIAERRNCTQELGCWHFLHVFTHLRT